MPRDVPDPLRLLLDKVDADGLGANITGQASLRMLLGRRERITDIFVRFIGRVSQTFYRIAGTWNSLFSLRLIFCARGQTHLINGPHAKACRTPSALESPE